MIGTAVDPGLKSFPTNILRWFVDVSRDEAKHRLIKRHLEAGIETTTVGAEERVEANDLRNGDLILANMIQPNVVLRG
jgi:pantothenate kinase